jgi:hypothetical protein
MEDIVIFWKNISVYMIKKRTICFGSVTSRIFRLFVWLKYQRIKALIRFGRREPMRPPRQTGDISGQIFKEGVVYG